MVDAVVLESMQRRALMASETGAADGWGVESESLNFDST